MLVLCIGGFTCAPSALTTVLGRHAASGQRSFRLHLVKLMLVVCTRSRTIQFGWLAKLIEADGMTLRVGFGLSNRSLPCQCWPSPFGSWTDPALRLQST